MKALPIVADRLVLEPLSVSHADDMVSVLAAASLYEFTGGEPPTLSALQERYGYQVAGSLTEGEVWCNWIIRTKADSRAVGFVQATVIGDTADVAWVIGVDDQGRGVATEAAAAMCEWLARHDVRHVTAHIHPRHHASQAVAAHLGLVGTGTFDDDGEQLWTEPGVDAD